jgi:hypothetical protein
LREYQLDDSPLGTHYWPTFIAKDSHSPFKVWLHLHSFSDDLLRGRLNSSQKLDWALLTDNDTFPPRLGQIKRGYVGKEKKFDAQWQDKENWKLREEPWGSLYLLDDLNPESLGWEYAYTLNSKEKDADFLFWEGTSEINRGIFPHIGKTYGEHLRNNLPADEVLSIYRVGMDTKTKKVFVRPPAN